MRISTFLKIPLLFIFLSFFASNILQAQLPEGCCTADYFEGEPTEPGWQDDYNGWYDLEGCGTCNAYCRWVGLSGSGGDPTGRPTFGSSFWTCHTSTGPRTSPMRSFRAPRCSERGGFSSAALDEACNSLLPVGLIHFLATSKDNQIQLDWATADEVNNSGFEVQRSIDGRHFTTIGWMPGNGTTVEESTYQFIDEEVEVNTNYYYRLQQIDNDGSFEFSPLRLAMVKDENAVQVGELFPNPISPGQAVANFSLNMPVEGTVVLQVFDGRGALVKRFSTFYNRGSSWHYIPINEFAIGHYFVQFQLGKEVVYRKLIVN